MQINFEYLRDSDAITPEEGELLYALVRSIKPKVCVETGTHKMLSTHYIAQALKDNGKGHLTTCDPIDLGQNSIWENSELKDFITFKPIKGIDLGMDDTIDFLFIDGFHGVDDVLEEFVHFHPKFSKNTIVVFHDCDPTDWNNTLGVNGAVTTLGIKTVFIPTQNRMRIYEHSNT
jgi:predicted O-methyltransferase YrrM